MELQKLTQYVAELEAKVEMLNLTLRAIAIQHKLNSVDKDEYDRVLKTEINKAYSKYGLID